MLLITFNVSNRMYIIMTVSNKYTSLSPSLSPSLPLSLGRYSTQHIIKFFKDKLKSMPCQNQGFVLDGFPKTEEEAKELFGRKHVWRLPYIQRSSTMCQCLIFLQFYPVYIVC